MKKIVMLLCLVLTLTFAAAGLADEVPAGLLGDWLLATVNGFAQNDVELIYTFTETEVSMKATSDGMTDTASAAYTIEGDAIVANDIPVTFLLEANTLILSDGYQTMVFTRMDASEPDEVSALLGKWVIDVERTEGMTEGMSGYIVFTETEMAMTSIFSGASNTITAPYTVEDGEIVIDGEGLPFLIVGDVLMLIGEEYAGEGAVIVLDRAPEEEATIIGEWLIEEMTGDAEAAEYLSLIKAMGGQMTVTFTETEMTLKMDLAGQVMEESSEYVIVGNQIINGGAALDFVLEGDRLSLTNEETAMVLVRMTEDAAADTADATADETVEARRSDSIIGEWTLMAMTGNEDAEQMWAMMEAMGATIDLTITETTATLIMEAMGKSNVQTIDGHVVGNTVVDSNGETQFVLEDGLVKMYSDDGITMVFQVK